MTLASQFQALMTVLDMSYQVPPVFETLAANAALGFFGFVRMAPDAEISCQCFTAFYIRR
jgi:hypothetical protein